MIKKKTIETTLTTNECINNSEGKTYKVEFISDLYSLSWGYRTGTVIELDESTYLIAKKYNSIKDI
jgi:hypothetical protein